MKPKQGLAIFASAEAEMRYQWVNEFIEQAKAYRDEGSKASARISLDAALQWVWSADLWARLAKWLDKDKL